MTANAKGEAAIKLELCGIEAICDEIAEGKSITQLAQDLDVSQGSLITWLNSDAERSARVKYARSVTAHLWDEKAEMGLERAQDGFELARAKELAHHYRWRSAKIAPKEYGEKITTELTGADGGAIATKLDTSGLSIEQLRALASIAVQP